MPYHNKIQLCPHDAMLSTAKITSYVCINHPHQARVAGQLDTLALANKQLTSDLYECLALYTIICHTDNITYYDFESRLKLKDIVPATCRKKQIMVLSF